MDNEKMIRTLQLFDIGKQVQQKAKKSGKDWVDVKVPTWNWTKYDYRIKPCKNNLINKFAKSEGFARVNVRIFHNEDGYVGVSIVNTDRIKRLVEVGYSLDGHLMLDTDREVKQIEG